MVRRGRVYAGYSGWGAGQLEAELAEEAWIVEPPLPAELFAPNPEDLWPRRSRAQGRSVRPARPDARRSDSELGRDGGGEDLRDRRRVVRDRLLSGASRARDRVRLLRGRLRGGRQLALPERQPDVVGVPVAAHQHLAAHDGLRDVPDARGLPGLSEPLADRSLLRRLRRSLRVSRPDPLSDRGRAGRAGCRRPLAGALALARRRGGGGGDLRRRDGRQRAPLGRALARASVPGPGPLRGRAVTRARLQDAGRARGQARAGARDRQLGHRHRGRVVADRGADLSGDAPRRLDPAQVPARQADRRARQRAHQPAAARRRPGRSTAGR